MANPAQYSRYGHFAHGNTILSARCALAVGGLGGLSALPVAATCLFGDWGMWILLPGFSEARARVET